MNARPLALVVSATCLAFALLARGLAGQSVPAGTPGTLTVLSKDGRRTIATSLINNQEFTALDDLSAAFQLVIQEGSGAITVTYKGKTIILTPDQALASVSGRLVSMPSAPVRSGRRWLVPLEFISRGLAPIYDTRLDLRKPAHLLVVGDLRVPRLSARYETLGAAARLTIDATPRATSTVVQEGDRLTVKFDADAVDATSPLIASQPPASLVQAVRVIDPVTLSVDLGPRVAGFRTSSEQVDAASRLVIDFVAAQTSNEAGSPAATAPPPELPPVLTQAAATIRTIAIDPGHGGDDEGAKGPGGSKEKDITLAVARRLKASIESRLGIRVLLTRDDDQSVAVDDRTSLANNNKADMFISLHANASLRRATSGATIFSASFAHEAEQRVRASLAPERLPTFGGGLRDIEIVPWDLAQIRHLDQSVAFAGILEQQLRDRVPMAAHAVDQAPLRILQSANMPAVLIEMAFVTNAAQEQALNGNGFQAAFVQGVYDSIIRFRDSLGAGGAQ